MMHKPILSLPITPQLEQAIKQEAKTEHLSKADVVRRILLSYYGLLKRYST